MVQVENDGVDLLAYRPIDQVRRREFLVLVVLHDDGEAHLVADEHVVDERGHEALLVALGGRPHHLDGDS